jgi:zeta-carotene desaturase
MSNDVQHWDVIIVGAGVAGIAAAVHCAQKGMRVLVVEQRPYIGGRARSFVDRTTGDIIDNGQHLAMGCYHALLSTLKPLGTDSLFTRQAALRVEFVDAAHGSDLLDAGVLPGKAGVALGIMRLRGIPLTQRIAAQWFALRVMTGTLATKGLTCSELLRRHGQGREIIKRLWEPIILATLNAPADTAAASLLVTVLRRAFFGTTTDAQLLLPTHGLSSLFDPFPTWLHAHHGEVRTSTAVERLDAHEDQAALTFTDGRTATAATCILAVPPRSMERLVPGLWISDQLRDTLHALDLSPIISVYLWYDRQWMTTDFVAMLDATVQWVFDRRHLTETTPDVAERFPGHVALTISAGSELAQRDSEDIIRVCDAELRAAFPALQGVTLLHGQVIKEKGATFLSTPHNEPLRPRTDALHASAHRAHRARVLLAGDWTATGLPATLEGAAQSGITAARMVCAVRGER